MEQMELRAILFASKVYWLLHASCFTLSLNLFYLLLDLASPAITQEIEKKNKKQKNSLFLFFESSLVFSAVLKT